MIEKSEPGVEAKGLAEELGAGGYQVIGKPRPRHDAWSKVLGQTVYAGDYRVSGMLYAKVLRSEHAAARLLRIDTGEAEKMPGVVAVMTAKDVPHNETVTRFGQTHEVGGFEGLYRVLADKKVRFKGEAVALIAAETLEIACEALEKIKVAYEPLEGVFDLEEAMKPESYRVGEETSNIVCSYRIRKGDAAEGFSRADLIVENTYCVQMVDHAYLEPEAGVAWMDENGVVTIRAATQVIEHFRGIAEVLGLPHNKVRVITPMLGGGFGGKEDITVETYLALLVQKTGRPVSLTFTREESILAHSKRHPYVMRYKTGVTREGKLVAMQAELISDAGGYVFLSPWVLLYSTVTATGPYDIPNVHVDAYTVLTNNTFTSANRGFGANQPCFAFESQLDLLAKKLGMTPLQIRKRNYLHSGGSLATNWVLQTSVETEATAEKVVEALGKPRERRHPAQRIGQGIASCMSPYGRMVFLHDSSRSTVSVDLDGSVMVRCGVQDLGGGQASSLAQIAAEVLGTPMEQVTVFHGDSALTPLAGTTTATRQLYMSGNATLKAAATVRQNLLRKAGEILGIDPEILTIRDGRVFASSERRAWRVVEGWNRECSVTCHDPGAIGTLQACMTHCTEKVLTLKDVIRACASEGIPLFHTAQFNAPAGELMDFEHGKGQVWPDLTFGTTGMEVAVDVETGMVDVLRIVSCFDVGQAINPLSVEGQLEGGAVYGLGYGLCEEVILKKGITLTPSFAEYLIPTASDVPPVQTILIESRGGLGPFGAKGVGEPANVPAAAALANAVADAIGTRIDDLPVTPDKILRALGKI